MGQNNWEGGARPPVPLSDGLDTRPCKILDPRLARDHLAPGKSMPLYHERKVVVAWVSASRRLAASNSPTDRLPVLYFASFPFLTE